MMMMHHCFRQKNLYQDFSISFCPFAESTIINVSLMFKICVSIFTIISGYGLYLSFVNKSKKLSTIRWVIIREIKLLSGFWFIFVFACIICQFIDKRPELCYFSNNWSEGIINLLVDFFGLAHLFGTNTLTLTWWYMSAAFIYILVLPLLVNMSFHFVFLFIGIFVTPFIFDFGYLGNNSIYYFFPAFVIGIIAAKYKLIDKYNNLKINIKLKFIIEFLILYMSYRIYLIVSNELFYIFKWGIYPFLIILFFVNYLEIFPKVKKVLIFLGKHSMNIFLLHTFIKTNYLRDFIYSFPHFIINIIVLLVFSIVLSMIVEKLKKLIYYQNLIDYFIKK